MEISITDGSGTIKTNTDWKPRTIYMSDEMYNELYSLANWCKVTVSEYIRCLTEEEFKRIQKIIDNAGKEDNDNV